MKFLSHNTAKTLGHFTIFEEKKTFFIMFFSFIKLFHRMLKIYFLNYWFFLFFPRGDMDYYYTRWLARCALHNGRYNDCKPKFNLHDFSYFENVLNEPSFKSSIAFHRVKCVPKQSLSKSTWDLGQNWRRGAISAPTRWKYFVSSKKFLYKITFKGTVKKRL